MPRRLRIAAHYALGAWVVVVLAVTLWPTPVDKPVATELRHAIDTAHAAGAPPKLGYNLIEYSANALLFVPIGILLALLLAQHNWWFAPILALCLSLSIELIQALALPERTASPVDLAYNTGGALLGALLVVALRIARARLRASRAHTPRTPTPRASF
jgi:VanZ family protein